jgi:hypothetical protein
MTTDVSASAHEQTPHETETNSTTTNRTTTISDDLRRRAQSLINDTAIDPQWRTIVRYALEVNDPWLGDVVRRAEVGEEIIDSVDFSLTPDN